MRPFTIRSIGFGLISGALLCAMNSLLVLKFGIMEEGPTIAALFFFSVFVWFKLNITVEEMVVVATMGSAGGSLGFMANFYAAQAMIGDPYTFWDMVLMNSATSLIGLTVVVIMRQLFVVENEKLPKDKQLRWVPAKVVHGMIETLVESRDRAQPWYLFITLALATTYVVLNDSGVGLVPEVAKFPWFGLAALGAGVAFAPLCVGAGYMMGLRICFGFLVGGVFLIIIAPYTENPARPHTYLWPGIGLLLGTGISMLIARWNIISNSIRSLTKFTGSEGDRMLSPTQLKWFTFLSLTIACSLLYFYFHLTVIIILVMLAVGGILLNTIAITAQAQTCFNPARVMAVILQGCAAISGGASASTNLTGAGFVSGAGAQAGNLTGDMAYGRWFGFLASRQFWLQIATLPVIVVVSAWSCEFIIENMPLSLDPKEDSLPAPVAKMWASMALLFDPDKGKNLPTFALESMGIAAAVGAAWVWLEERRSKLMIMWETAKKRANERGERAPRRPLLNYVPSALGTGLALILPIYYNFSFFLGGVLMIVILPYVFKTRKMTLETIAVGLLIAEGAGGMLTGILRLADVLRIFPAF